MGNREALQAAWEQEWTISQKRAIITALVDTLIVHPDPNCGSRFRPERVEITMKA